MHVWQVGTYVKFRTVFISNVLSQFNKGDFSTIFWLRTSTQNWFILPLLCLTLPILSTYFSHSLNFKEEKKTSVRIFIVWDGNSTRYDPNKKPVFLLFISLTNSMERSFLQKLIVIQPVKLFLAVYWNLMFIFVFTTDLSLPLPCARSTSPHIPKDFFKIVSRIILPSTPSSNK